MEEFLNLHTHEDRMDGVEIITSTIIQKDNKEMEIHEYK